jgi:tyrosyl-tRNA synthetase
MTKISPDSRQISTVDLDRLGRNFEQVHSFDELRARLERGRPLRIKYGVDVTAPFLHIGHAVNLWMMRYLQECGHRVVFLIGDFTTRIGDPTGKASTRPVISEADIEKNSSEFIAQVQRVLHSDPEVFEIRRNSEWFSKMAVSDLMGLLAMVTHARLIRRDMFQKRIEAHHEIAMHELLYPILQGYDSVMLESDLTIVGTDQLFNEMMGRFYQERFGQMPQVVVTTKITPGLDGVEKQSKSLGNYIALTDTPRDKFGKIMSLPDALIVQFLHVYTEVPLEDVRNVEEGLKAGTVHPMAAKKRLGHALVERYHGREVADGEQEWFENTFSRRAIPADVPEIVLPRDVSLLDALQACMPGRSRSELRRLVEQRAVQLNDVTLDVKGIPHRLDFSDGDVMKVGKTRWFKIFHPN